MRRLRQHPNGSIVDVTDPEKPPVLLARIVYADAEMNAAMVSAAVNEMARRHGRATLENDGCAKCSSADAEKW